jgi:hypothetical protein
MLSKNIFIVVSFLTVVFTSSISAQQPTEILFGTYLPSSNFPEITYHRFNDTNLVKLGFNTILQTVMHPDIHKSLFDTVSNIWWDNRSPLAGSTFDNIVAMNGNWNRADQSLQQVDWIKILTHGVYNNWEAEGGDGGFYSDQIKMERNLDQTDIFDIDGITGVKTRVPIDTMLIESERSLLRGPFMYQDQIYKVGFRYGNDTISYKAKFSMKIGHKPEQPLAVCTLKVKIIYPISDSTYSEKLLASLPLTTVSFNSENYSTFVLSYKIEGLPGNITDSPDISNDFKSASLNFMNTKVYYEVVLAPYCDPRNYRHLYIDNIEVVDVDIWERHGNQISTLLTSYNNLWKADDAGSVYEDKIKYFYTMDEPHSYDHYIPYREVEAVQKTIDPFMKDKLMLTKIYPEWDGYKEGLNVIDTWAEVVKPRKLMFWYYTIFNVQEGTYISQLQLRDRLREAANYDKDFFYTAQTFGTRKLQYMGVFPPLDSHYHKYRTPTGSQALGQSMLALAYGSKGIFYETYYSYISSAPGWGDYFAESLVGNNSDDFDRPRSNDYGLYDTIVSLGKRLKGPLGNLLPKLEFSGEESYIYNNWERGRGQNSINPTKLKIFGEGIPEYPNDRFLNLGITRLHPKGSSNLTGDYYFLLNQITFDNISWNPEVVSTYNNIHIGITVGGLKNWKFYDVEGGSYFNFTKLPNPSGVDFTATIPLGKGDGRLYRLIPTMSSTGTLLTDEVITAGEIISSEGAITVPTGVTLKIEGNYTLTDSLIIEDGGVLTLEPGSTLNLDSASSVYCAGDIYVNGTETNKVTINFLQSNETKQNSIYLGRESSAIIKYAQIKNGYSGITATNGFDTLIIDNCNFTNISHSALLLNGNGYDNAKIKNNTYTNCDYAGFFSNLATVAVNSDSANTTSGYYFSGIEYALPKEGLVTIKLYDITGRLVKQLVNEQKPSGRHKTTIESGNLASGIYIYSLKVNDININKKLVILK